MKIFIAAATGTGPTPLSAFDAALCDVGIENQNLIYLSSVIPPRAEIVQVNTGETIDVGADWGDRLYVVIAEHRATEPGEEAWAGIGWVQEGDGRGLFVEHHGSSEASVRKDIQSSLAAMVSLREHNNFGDFNMKISGGHCEGEPLSVMVVACYQAESWTGQSRVIAS